MHIDRRLALTDDFHAEIFAVPLCHLDRILDVNSNMFETYLIAGTCRLLL
jgi:hypothetical protein